MNMNGSKRARERDTPNELQVSGKRSKCCAAAENQPAASSSPASGGKSTIGQRKRQEDAFIANQKVALSTPDEREASIFGVFDGHGGSNVSEFLARNVQDFVQRALLAEPRCKEAALKEAFVNLDASLPADSAVQTGSTALLVVVDDSSVVCANCGDSRAVLCRGGEAIALSNDHKPDREDEQARIEKAGGRIFNFEGARVMGVLGMTRAIGYTSLRLHGVIPEPEVTIWDRHPDDEFLLLASDGLWDVLSNEEATDSAKQSMQRALSQGASRKKAAFVAAAVLVRKATDRASKDNITVIVVDLQTRRPAEQVKAPSPSAPGQLAVMPLPSNRAIGRAHSLPTRLLVDQVRKGSSTGSGCTPSLLSAERLLLISASSAPPALLVLAS